MKSSALAVAVGLVLDNYMKSKRKCPAINTTTTTTTNTTEPYQHQSEYENKSKNPDTFLAWLFTYPYTPILTLTAILSFYLFVLLFFLEPSIRTLEETEETGGGGGGGRGKRRKIRWQYDPAWKKYRGEFFVIATCCVILTFYYFDQLSFFLFSYSARVIHESRALKAM